MDVIIVIEIHESKKLVGEKYTMKVKSKSFIRLLAKYLKNQKLMIFFLMVVILSGIAVQLINPQIVRNFVDTALKSNNNTALTKMAILYIILAVMQQFLAILTTYFAQKIGWSATNSLREDLVDHCLNLDMKFHKEKRPGELIEIIDGDVNMLFNFFSRMAIMLLSNTILMVGVLALYFREDYRMGIAQVIFCVIAFFVSMKFKNKGKKYWKKNREVATGLFGFVGESINNKEDVKANGAKGYVMYRLHEHLKEWYPSRIKSSVAGWGMFMISLALQAASFAISLVIGTYLWKKNMVTAGTILMFYNYTYYLVRPIDAIQRQLQDMQSAGASISRIEELLLKESTVKDSKSDLILNGKFDLSIDNLLLVMIKMLKY